MPPTLGCYETQDDNALATVAQWIECQPANQRVADSIPSWHMPGLQARSPVEGVQEAVTH